MVLPIDDAHQSDAAELIKDRNAHMLLLKENLIKAQNRMKNQADRHRTEKEFQMGE
jgi:hypothetical protein